MGNNIIDVLPKTISDEIEKVKLELKNKNKNPYQYNYLDMDEKLFLGRDLLLSQFDKIVEQMEFPKNYLILGDKTIGKSSLLRFVEKKFNNYYATVTIELPKSDLGKTYFNNENKFFTEIIGKLIQIYKNDADDEKNDENNFLHHEQINNFYNYKNKEYSAIGKIPRLEIYHNRSDQLDYSVAINTMQTIIADLHAESDTMGLIIFIDEFQEIQNYPKCLELLNRATMEISNLMIIGTGTDTINEKIKANLAKFFQKTQVIPLKGINENHLQKLITKPIFDQLDNDNIEKRNIIENYMIDKNFKIEIENRTDKNPDHIRIICESAYELLLNGQNETIILNEKVKEDIIGKYRGYSDQSQHFKDYLENMSISQLAIFQDSLFLRNFNIKENIKFSLAFNAIVESDEKEKLQRIQEKLEKIKEFKLLNFYYDNKKITFNEFNNGCNVNNSFKYKYKFSGDNIDRIYVSLILEKRLQEKFTKGIWNQTNYKRALVIKYIEEFIKDILSTKKVDISFDHEEFNRFLPEPINWGNFKRDSNKILSYDPEKITPELDVNIDNETTQKINRVKQFTSKYHLYDIAGAFDTDENKINLGWYIIYIEIKIAGKDYIVKKSIQIPTEKINLNYQDIKFELNHLKNINNDYEIQIKHLNIYPIPHKAAKNVRIVIIHDLEKLVFQSVLELDFQRAYAFSLVDHNITQTVYSLNNLCFTKLLVNDNVMELRKILDSILNKSPMANINYAYLLSLKEFEEIDESIKIYKKQLKIVSNEDQCFALLLCLLNDKIDSKNKLVLKCSSKKVILWNYLLLSGYIKKDSFDTIKQFVEKELNNLAKDSIYENFVTERVLYWSNYYLDDNKNVFKEQSNQLYDKIKKENSNEFFSKDLLIDQIGLDAKLFS